jgi:hypothetical protein
MLMFLYFQPKWKIKNSQRKQLAKFIDPIPPLIKQTRRDEVSVVIDVYVLVVVNNG